ncbi:YhcN/YlaJ family sporulation lipoprotein [Terrilactibacillus laevilacticus]|uniref:YhcN/YlaJ family sporulation lipoprotein n=1 Tax=Terrilactibacillus laevilacticus TaxID=1380157 RepID=A0ABW5PQA6_9BACI|nr:YhcN/YlaJ family sporulation lipoprotein [Terrilactibacillus laevilacticus]
MKIKIIFIFFLSLAIVSGCSFHSQTEEQDFLKRDSTNQPKVHQMNQSIDYPSKTMSNQDIARRLVHLAEQTPEVKSATALIVGKYAVVGLTLDKHLDRTRVGTVKYTVSQAIKNDPYGANAVITSNPDVIERLREIGQAFKHGRPISGIANELADVVERVIPEFTKNVKDNQNENKPSKLNQKTNKHQVPAQRQKDEQRPRNHHQKEKIENQQKEEIHQS